MSTHFLSLIFENFYQIIGNIIEIKDKVEENNITNIFNEINDKIIKLLNFFNTNIIKNNLYENNMSETKTFFYQMITLLFKFIEIQELHLNTFKSICEILNSFNNDINSASKQNKELTNFLLLITSILFEFLINPRLFKEKNSESFDKINYVFLSLLTFLKLNDFQNLNKMLKKENLDILLSYIWLLDEPLQITNFKITKKNYIAFLVLFLQISYSFIAFEEKKAKSSKNIILDTNDNINIINKRNSIINTNEESLENYFINIVCNKAMQYRKNPNILFNLSLIMVKSNLIPFLGKTEIGKIKNYFLFENKDDESRDSKDKKILYLSYLQILLPFYYSKTKKENSKEDYFKDFLKNNKLYFDLDLFYAFIALIREISNFGKLNRIGINSCEFEDFRQYSRYDHLEFSDLPMNEINPSFLNQLESDIIKSILLYIIFLIEKSFKKSSKRRKDNNENNTENSSSQGLENKTEQIAFDILKKNIDIIFKYPKTRLYEIVFS